MNQLKPASSLLVVFAISTVALVVALGAFSSGTSNISLKVFAPTARPNMVTQSKRGTDSRTSRFVAQPGLYAAGSPVVNQKEGVTALHAATQKEGALAMQAATRDSKLEEFSATDNLPSSQDVPSVHVRFAGMLFVMVGVALVALRRALNSPQGPEAYPLTKVAVMAVDEPVDAEEIISKATQNAQKAAEAAAKLAANLEAKAKKVENPSDAPVEIPVVAITEPVEEPAQIAIADSSQIEKLEKEKRISKVEIPNFIMRDDFIDQLYRWANALGQEENGIGMVFECTPKYIETEQDGLMLWGFTTEFIHNGDSQCKLFCGFDFDSSRKYQFISRNLETGMPDMRGAYDDVLGKYFEIWKLGKEPVDDNTKHSVKIFCGDLATAVTKYYSFGSCWSEDL